MVNTSRRASTETTRGPEYRTVFIKAQYNTFLGRDPAASEITFWQGQFQGGVTQEQLIASLMGDPSYFARAPIILGAGTPSNDTFVRAAYKQLFPGYTVSQGEVDNWVAQLNAKTITPQQVATILDTSDLYRFGTYMPGNGGSYVNGFVNRTYVRLLGRNAVQAEIDHWVSVYHANPTLRTEDFLATILDSPEYFRIPTPTHSIP